MAASSGQSASSSRKMSACCRPPASGPLPLRIIPCRTSCRGQSYHPGSRRFSHDGIKTSSRTALANAPQLRPCAEGHFQEGRRGWTCVWNTASRPHGCRPPEESSVMPFFSTASRALGSVIHIKNAAPHARIQIPARRGWARP